MLHLSSYTHFWGKLGTNDCCLFTNNPKLQTQLEENSFIKPTKQKYTSNNLTIITFYCQNSSWLIM